MHFALLLDEVLRYIARSGLSKSDLVAMAITCREWSEPALDELWETLDSFVPLVSTLPCDLVYKVAPYSPQPSDWTDLLLPGVPRMAYAFSREPQPSEWNTVRKYAGRVRYFTGPFKHPIRRDRSRNLNVTGVNTVTAHILHILSHHRPLFPGLQKVVWQYATVESIYILRLLAGPTVSVLHLPGFTQTIPPRPHDSLENEDIKKAITLISSLSSLFPSLRSFGFMHHTFHDFEMASAMWDSVRCWAYMSTFSCRIFNGASMKYLENLSSLRQLTLHILDGGFSSCSPGLKVSLPHLQDLRLFGAGPDVVKMLDVLSAGVSLKRLECTVERVNSTHTTLDLSSLLHLLSERCDENNLQSLVVYEYPSPPGHSSDITLSTLQPAFCFRELTVICIDTYRSISLTDSDLIDIASAWPKVTTLRINPGVGWILPSKVTLRGFAEVLKLLPCLEHTALAIDARVTPSDSGEVKSDTIRHASLKTLNLTDSRVGDNHEEVVRWFSQAVTVPDDCVFSVNQPHGSHHDWTTIFDSLRRFHRKC